MSKVTLTSSDNQEFTIDREIAIMSNTVKSMLEEIGGDTIPISNVRGIALGKVIEYCQHHKEHPDPPMAEADKYRTDNITPWDKTFIDVEMQLLFEVVMAANYLDVKGLLDLGCKTMTNMIKGHSFEEVKEKFRIPEGTQLQAP